MGVVGEMLIAYVGGVLVTLVALLVMLGALPLLVVVMVILELIWALR